MGVAWFAGRLMVAAFFGLAGAGKLVDQPTADVQVGEAWIDPYGPGAAFRVCMQARLLQRKIDPFIRLPDSNMYARV
jgi:hypothetical protein